VQRCYQSILPANERPAFRAPSNIRTSYLTEIFEKSSTVGDLTVEYSPQYTLPMGPPPAQLGCSPRRN